MDIKKYANYILRNDGIEKYNSNLKNFGYSVEKSKILKKEKTLISSNFAKQIIYRRVINCYFLLLSDYKNSKENDENDETLFVLMNLIKKTNKVFDEKLDDENFTTTLSNICKILFKNIELEGKFFIPSFYINVDNNRTNIKKIIPLSKNDKVFLDKQLFYVNSILNNNQFYK